MGRILPFYRTGASLSGGGGGGALGTATVWGQVFDWTALGTIAGPLRVGDFAVVNDLQPGSGLAIYDGTDWRLYQAVFPTVADLLAFGELINSNAIATVGTGIETDPAYFYTGSAWERMADNVPFAWTLSSLDDFSAVGLQDGDYGVFTPSGGGRIVLRYKAACNRVGGGTVPLWVPPEAYAGTGLQIDCYAIGSENNTALAAQGLAVTQTNTGTVSSVGGYIRLDAPAVGSGNSVAQLTAPTITGSTKWWLTCEIRGGGANNWAGGLFQSSAESITQWSWGHIQALGARVQPFYWTTTWAVTTTTLNLQAGGRTFPSVVSTPWLVQALAANALSDQIPTTIDGLLYSQYRRDADSAVAATNFTLTPQAVGGTAGTSAQIDLRNFYRLTWT
jgi:hypothetical protein